VDGFAVHASIIIVCIAKHGDLANAEEGRYAE